MDIQELLAAAKEQPFELFERKLNSLVRENYKFANLDEANRKIVLNIIKKHLDDIHDGRGVSSTVLERESYKLYQDRLKHKLTEEDLKDIKEILNLFKK